MKESIYTIPISQVFEPKQGCPLCALARALDTRWAQYITGAAMMEPDVRIRTNEEGFCGRHLSGMLAQRNRLSVALLLQTRLDYVLSHLDDPTPNSGWGRKEATKSSSTCFVCNRVENELNRLADNLVTIWVRENSFRQLYAHQEYLCVPHHRLLCCAAEKLKGENRSQFQAETTALARRGLKLVKEDVDAFCKLFDYRDSGAEQPTQQVATAVERAAALLCGGAAANT